ncbi:uncharacterized protein LOC121553507 [Coregonus clupeaformis]|uniref:uncharacterized protein LOC121553507 n=1 Tax=Coregonus clupeaformis TaxID=59861 RepID=UPI001E1C87D5|nr:uncharacterized protein LOC121553507 [Coregonus clupeaformis]
MLSVLEYASVQAPALLRSPTLENPPRFIVQPQPPPQIEGFCSASNVFIRILGAAEGGGQRERRSIRFWALNTLWTSGFLSSAMTRPSTISLGLLILLIGYAAAGPESEFQPRAVRSSACQDHGTLHDRLDVVEKHVEDTVQKLEAELAVLLHTIEAPKWSPLLDTAGKHVVDILDGYGLVENGDS